MHHCLRTDERGEGSAAVHTFLVCWQGQRNVVPVVWALRVCRMFFTAKETAQGKKKKKSRCRPCAKSTRSVQKKSHLVERCLDNVLLKEFKSQANTKTVPDFLSKEDEGMKMLLYSCIRNLNSIRMSKNRN